MQLPNLLPKWLRGRSDEPEGSTPVSNLAAEPEGSAPKNLVFKAGIGLCVVAMAAVILLSPEEQAGNAQEPAAAPLPPPAGPAGVSQGEQSIQDSVERSRMEESRRQRTEQAAQESQQRWIEEQQREAELLSAARGGGGSRSAAKDEDLTPEQELRQTIRLEKIQRRHSSLRSPPVALSFRPAAATTPAVPQIQETPPAAAAPPEPAAPAAAPAPAQQPPAPSAAQRALVESDVVAARRRPRDPRGWERIDGGQWIEAVLVTQIRGDSPGPAIALVSTPFWSRDRQRILIPRGARFVGRVQAVTNWDQSRLAVTFDRLIFDGHSLRLPFAGLSQAGESGLKDQVNRHYLATFGAAGAVGVIAGLTLRNTQAYGLYMPAGQAARMEAGRSLGESASTIMNRFLNRLPTITIRAGHRIRIYFTSDLLVPRRPA